MDLSPDDDDSYLSKKGNSSEVIQLSNKCFSSVNILFCIQLFLCEESSQLTLS